MAATAVEKIANLDSKVELYGKIGLYVAGVFASVFTGLITWYLPKELGSQKAVIVTELKLEIDKVAKLQLDRLAIQVADAQAGKVKADPRAVQKLGRDTLELAESKNPDVSQAAWHAANSVISYYSFVNQTTPQWVRDIGKNGFLVSSSARNVECMRGSQTSGTPTIQFDGLILENCTLHVNQATQHSIAFRNTIFRDVTFVYEGAKITGTNVAFINCKFELSPDDPGKKLGEMLLTTNYLPILSVP